MSNGTDEKLTEKEIKILKAIRGMKFGKVEIHIQNSTPARIVVEESILL